MPQSSIDCGVFGRHEVLLELAQTLMMKLRYDVIVVFIVGCGMLHGRKVECASPEEVKVFSPP